MKTLVLANQKGGVGKSAIATQLAHYSRTIGLRVLVIDLDHQRNTSRPLMAHADVMTLPVTSGTVLEEDATVEIRTTDQIVLLAGDDKLTALEKQAGNHNAFATRLRNLLKACDQSFDLCIIDTNPNPDIRYASALISADYALAPVQLNQEAIEGIAGLLGHPRFGLSKIKTALNPKLELGILPNLVEPTPFQRGNMITLTEKFGTRLVSEKRAGETRYGFIPKRSAIAEAQAVGQFLPELKKTAARDAWNEIQPVFDMVLSRMGFKIASEALN